MKCLRCQNEDQKYFYRDRQGVWYCRKCIPFGRIDVGALPKKKRYRKRSFSVSYQLDYELTAYQKRAAKELISYLKQHQDVLVYAATGAGKTEITMAAIESYLREGKKVGVAIARRQVVLEIRDRMAKAFPTLDVIAVCEGHTRKVDGDLIVCTMHQLYRYYRTFDLLILDEVDAFPYYGNEVLEAIAHHSCQGEKVYLSATPDRKMKQQVKEGKLKQIQLFCRPHGKDLIVPKVYCLPKIGQRIMLFFLIYRNGKENVPLLVFVPRIAQAHTMAKFYSLVAHCKAISSQSTNRDLLMEQFRNNEFQVLFTTTLLERGITIPGVDVCVVDGEHTVFSEASLIQIFGRVGRSITKPDGNAWFLCTHSVASIKNCVATICYMNAKKQEEDKE